MGFATLIIWFATVLLGLFMLAVWLIENDVTGQGVAPSRLPVPVIFAHLGLAATGLTVWSAFLIFDQKTLAWAETSRKRPWPSPRKSCASCSKGTPKTSWAVR